MIHAKRKVVCESANRVTSLVAILVCESEQNRADTVKLAVTGRAFRNRC